MRLKRWTKHYTFKKITPADVLYHKIKEIIEVYETNIHLGSKVSRGKMLFIV